MNKQEVNSLEKLELYYNKCRKIRLENTTYNDIQKVIDQVIEGKEKTYFSKGGHQCGHGHYRSLDDVIKVCKYYFPEYSLKQILIEILNYSTSKSNIAKYPRPLYLQFCYCANIRKDNFRGFATWNYDSFEKSLHRINILDQGFINYNITLQEIINN